MKTMYPVPGTKERSRTHDCLTFTHKADGGVVLDRVHPRDHQAAVQRLWRLYGRHSIRMTSRRMERGETYVAVEGLVKA